MGHLIVLSTTKLSVYYDPLLLWVCFLVAACCAGVLVLVSRSAWDARWVRRAAWLAGVCAGVVLLVYLRFALDTLYRAAIFTEANRLQFDVALVICGMLALASLVLMLAALIARLMSRSFGA